MSETFYVTELILLQLPGSHDTITYPTEGGEMSNRKRKFSATSDGAERREEEGRAEGVRNMGGEGGSEKAEGEAELFKCFNPYHFFKGHIWQVSML